MPNSIKDSCCDGRDDCIDDIKAPEKRPTLGNMTDLVSGVTNTNDNSQAKDRLVKSAICQCWCTVILDIFLLVIWLIQGAQISFVIQAFIIYLLFSMLNIWCLRCCIRMDDKCWFIILVILYGLNVGNAFQKAYWDFNLAQYGAAYAITAILSIFIALSQLFLFIYGICYIKTWPQEGGGSV